MISCHFEGRRWIYLSLRTSTDWPAWRKATAAQSPAMPAPTTIIFNGIALCVFISSVISVLLCSSFQWVTEQACCSSSHGEARNKFRSAKFSAGSTSRLCNFRCPENYLEGKGRMFGDWHILARLNNVSRTPKSSLRLTHKATIRIQQKQLASFSSLPRTYSLCPSILIL